MTSPTLPKHRQSVLSMLCFVRHCCETKKKRGEISPVVVLVLFHDFCWCCWSDPVPPDLLSGSQSSRALAVLNSRERRSPQRKTDDQTAPGQLSATDTRRGQDRASSADPRSVALTCEFLAGPALGVVTPARSTGSLPFTLFGEKERRGGQKKTLGRVNNKDLAQ